LSSKKIFSSETSWLNESKLGRKHPWPIRNKNCPWWPSLLTDQEEMSTIYRGPSIDASHQVSVYLAKWFQRRRFLEIDQSETKIACGGHVR
jgi:hypothetical protein